MFKQFEQLTPPQSLEATPIPQSPEVRAHARRVAEARVGVEAARALQHAEGSLPFARLAPQERQLSPGELGSRLVGQAAANTALVMRSDMLNGTLTQPRHEYPKLN